MTELSNQSIFLIKKKRKGEMKITLLVSEKEERKKEPKKSDENEKLTNHNLSGLRTYFQLNLAS